ncbi:MAG: hypothetical protein A2Y34_15390 [Spirochaetes bacterium GWC1_27_15]|nr:MAG: hypothetical protein A2Z98_09250 [Spirochaetes bacterium GWB1_27_13]OHD23667.1 MAG: hypothetical protein A2Y34_15390 [Spirochaetes bacterium GWC1_27_15]
MTEDKDLKTNDGNNKGVYFLDLTVENVLCFKERQTLDLSDGNGNPAMWTVILGDNGVGKTTLLKCLGSFEPEEIQHTHKDGNLSIDYLPNQTISNELDKNFYIKASIFNNYNFNNYKKNIFDIYFSYDFIGKEKDFGFYENLLIFAYSASRTYNYSPLSEKKSDENTVESLFSNDVKLINAEEWLLQTDYSIKSADDEVKIFYQKKFEKIKQILLKLLPEIEDIQIKNVTKENTRPKVEFKTPYGWVNIRGLSLGYQTMIGWMVDLANKLFERYPESDNPLEEPAVVLVDEIDLHLHPKWQKSIMSYLSNIFKKTQFIVTAHSPLIVQSAENANIVLLRREGDEVKIYNKKNSNEINKWRIDQIITSDLFDLDSARSYKYDEIIKRKNEILQKQELSEEDKKELEEIGKKLDELPIIIDKNRNQDTIDLLLKASEILKE